MGELVQIVGFELDGEPYGFPIEDVREILQMVEIRPVPDAPPHLCGAINVRGRVLPVVDLRTILGLETRPYDLRTPIVVLEDEAKAVGVVVDEVTDVVGAGEECFEPPDDSYPMGEMLQSVCKLESQMLLVFDPRKLLGEEIPGEAVRSGE